MKKVTITLIILISLLGFNQVKADTIYIDLDTITSGSVLSQCQQDTINIFNSNVLNPDGIFHVSGGISYFSPYVVLTQNSITYSQDGGTSWNTETISSSDEWRMEWNMGFNTITFYVYFTSPTLEPWIDTELLICNASDTLYASPDSYQMGVKYSWYKDGELESEGYYPSDTSFIVTSSGQYVLITQGCNTIQDTIDMIIVDNTLPDFGDDIQFCGDINQPDLVFDINVIAPSGIYEDWEWSDGTDDMFMHITSPGIYWIEVNNECLNNVRDSIEITHISYPPVEILGQTNICPGGSTQLCTNFDFDVIAWYEITTTDTILHGPLTPCTNVSNDMNIMVYVAEGSCPSETYTIPVNVTQPYAESQLCIVTVNTNGNNEVHYDKVLDEGIAFYGIYRLGLTGYILIGTNSIDDPAMYEDLDANPMISANRYKITAIDTCGNESDLSHFHSTMHINSNPATGGGIDLTITDEYLDESGNYTPTEITIMIDSLNDGTFTPMDVISAVFNSYHIDNPHPGATYVVAINVPWACDGAKNGTLSMSNKSYTVTDIDALATNAKVSIFPNPSTGIFQIESNQEINQIEVFNVTGQLILSSNTNSIDLSDQPNGIYLIEIKTTNAVLVKKLIKE